MAVPRRHDAGHELDISAQYAREGHPSVDRRNSPRSIVVRGASEVAGRSGLMRLFFIRKVHRISAEADDEAAAEKWG